MISNEELEQCFSEIEGIDYIKVEGDGYHYQMTIVSNLFLGKSKVTRQQWVYSKLNDYIRSGSVHAISMKTLTKEEWEKSHG